MTDSVPAVQFRNLTDLSQIQQDIWISLQRSVTARDCGWRLPVLATRSGDTVRQRTVVLRRVDAATGCLFAHTDLRSPKVAQLLADARTSLLFYDHSAATQLVVTALASVHTDDTLAADFWESEPVSSLRGYLGPHSPGSPADQPNSNLPAEFLGRVPERGELTPARINFAVIRFEVKAIEWLHLSRQGNLRAVFPATHTSGDGEIFGGWLHP
ncbi:MAG: pyridoxamine 5'-phosphate oxidase family protein [Planctomycetaceae bacterium]|nr:pyridoxamine 5'-phosphate oxidase family protein [Planctomycetaceae bacterium]